MPPFNLVAEGCFDFPFVVFAAFALVFLLLALF